MAVKKEYLLLGSSHVINYFKTLALLAKHSYQDYKSLFWETRLPRNNKFSFQATKEGKLQGQCFSFSLLNVGTFIKGKLCLTSWGSLQYFVLSGLCHQQSTNLDEMRQKCMEIHISRFMYANIYKGSSRICVSYLLLEIAPWANANLQHFPLKGNEALASSAALD